MYTENTLLNAIHENDRLVLETMKDNDKRVALIRLRDILYSGVQPTVRESGFSAENVQELAKEGLIHPGEKMFSDKPDRCVIEEILPAGHTFILEHQALRDRHILSPVST